MDINWKFNSVFNYYDCSEGRNSVWDFAKIFAKYPEKKKQELATLIEDNITTLMDSIKDDYNKVQMFAFTVTSDLYKAVNIAYYYDQDIADYLEVAAKPFYRWIEKYGLQIHFLTNNTFSDYGRPLLVFEDYFNRCGLNYVCPQHMAFKAMQVVGLEYDDFEKNLPSFINIGKRVRDRLLQDIINSNRSYIHLDIDASDFVEIKEYAEKPGHLIVLKIEAPQESGKASVIVSESLK